MTTAVAIALYNGEKFIEMQLDSLRSQTQIPDQVVLCDDGSSDKTVQIVERYIEKYDLADFWMLVKNSQNLGYIWNFYKAISLCTAELVFLCDQDDLWKEDKIEKMSRIMENNGNIDLLSCQYGIIDAEGNQQHSVVERNLPESEMLQAVSVADIMRAYCWPGMVMCLRRTFFEKIYPVIEGKKVAHDLMFAVLAADTGSFYEYHYIGAYHRRHGNNAAREEHRVTKLLNLQRKLTDIAVTKELWHHLLEAELPVSRENQELISRRLELLERREAALKDQSLKQILKVYKDGGNYLRMKSLICDIWLVLFGKTSNE